MSPLFAAMPPADLPTNAYVAPVGIHSTAPVTVGLVMEPRGRSHTVSLGETVYGIADRYDVDPAAIVRANDLPSGGRWIMPGESLSIPGGDRASQESKAPSSSSGRSAAGAKVTVRAGDTLSHLAVRHGVSVSALVSANSIANSRLVYPGQVLTLPGSKAEPAARSASSGTRSASSSSSAAASSGSITVRAGDTLWDLAASNGVSVSALARANDLTASRHIYPGQQLRLPGSTSAPASSGSPAPSSAPARSTSSTPTSLNKPYDEHTVGDRMIGEQVPNTFLHYRYSDGVARAAAANRAYLSSTEVPGRDSMRALIVETSTRYGVDPDLMVALAYQESGWNHRAVSPANAIGAMQVIPTSGEWASMLVGRDLNLLDPGDNVTAGVVIMAALQRSAATSDDAVGAYYQGLGSVRQYGLFSDTQRYVANIRHLARTL